MVDGPRPLSVIPEGQEDCHPQRTLAEWLVTAASTLYFHVNDWSKVEAQEHVDSLVDAAETVMMIFGKL